MIPRTALKHRVGQDVVKPIQICINAWLISCSRNPITKDLRSRCNSGLTAICNNRLILKIVIHRQSWIMSRKAANHHRCLVSCLLVIPSVRIDIDTVRNSKTLALRNITAELIVNTTAPRWSAKSNTQNGEIDTRSLNGIPVNTSLVLADINTLRCSPIGKGVHGQ